MQGKIKSLEQIYLFSMPVKEYQIVENFLGSALKDEVMKIMPVQKQTRAGQRTRFKAFVVVGDHAGHVGLGVKCAKEVSQSAFARQSIASVYALGRAAHCSQRDSMHTVRKSASHVLLRRSLSHCLLFAVPTSNNVCLLYPAEATTGVCCTWQKN